MRWTHHGPIFKINESSLGISHQFAQGPQSLAMKELTRVYFSTRVIDSIGKYISHVYYVDFSVDLKQVICMSDSPIIAQGKLGTFDEHGIFPFHPFSWQGEIHAYTCGWSRRKSVDIEMAIGHAFSEDGGQTFIKSGLGPVLTASPNEPFLIGDPFALVTGEELELYYIFGTAWTLSESGVPERTYRIGSLKASDPKELARMADGRQIIISHSPTEAQAMPSVLEANGKKYMFFCFRDTFGFRSNGSKSGYRLGFAHTDEHGDWHRDDEFLPQFTETEGWDDGSMQCYPNVHRRGDTVFLLYNGNEFGKNGFNLLTIKVEDLP